MTAIRVILVPIQASENDIRSNRLVCIQTYAHIIRLRSTRNPHKKKANANADTYNHGGHLNKIDGNKLMQPLC